MSVIGTTHKQPRVFAHDAVTLRDLPGCLYRSISASIPRGSSNGSGFAQGEIYQALTTGAAGTVVNVLVTGVTGDGNITSYTILDTSCQSTNLSVGDNLTVVFRPTTGQEEGTNAIDFIQITELQTTGWEYGCPITPLGTRFPISEGDVPASYNPMFAYKQKDVVTFKCGDEDPCERKGLTPGASLYIGYDLLSLTVIMESGKKVTWRNIPSGSFMPVAVLTVCGAEAAGPDAPEADTLKEFILCLF